MKKRYALISIYDKKGIKDICETFLKFNINIISTGTTAKHITNLGYKCRSVTSFTKFKEVLDGRVKTLHPKLHASLLFDRDNYRHVNSFKKLKFPSLLFPKLWLYPIISLSIFNFFSKKLVIKSNAFIFENSLVKFIR